MAFDLFANNFQTTLATLAGSGDATITVAGAAPSGLQGAGQFRVLVDAELMIVTAGASGTTWTVTRAAEGTTAAAHLQGATVAHIVTAGGLGNAAVSAGQLPPPPIADLISYYGLKGDGTDETGTSTTGLTGAFNDAMTNGHALGCSRVGAKFGFSSTIAITSEVSFFGPGSSASNLDVDATYMTRPLCVFSWLVAGGAADMFYLNSASRPLFGMRWENCAFDGAAHASSLFHLDRVRMSEFRNMRFARGATNCLIVTTSSSTANDNSEYLTFSGMQIESRHAGCLPLLVSGNAGNTANTTHCTFIRTLIDTSGGGTSGPGGSGVVGIDCENSDNVDWFGVFIFSRSTAANAIGSGGSYGMYFGPYARGHYVHHLEPGSNGAYASTPNTATFSNTLWGYDRNNGQPEPTLASGANLDWYEVGQNASGGLHIGGGITNSGVYKNAAAANESTGAGSAALGANCPAVTASAPYKWIQMQTSDGSTVYVPVWK